MSDRDDNAEQRAAQARIAAIYRMEFLGMGPSATGGTTGWAMRTDLFFKCARCGYFMSADPTTYDTCFCGDLHKDAAAGRFGSTRGDASIEVYRAHPIDTGDATAG